nr:threonylcarbamoyl-AMP synthase [Acidobacteriota bacterium]
PRARVVLINRKSKIENRKSSAFIGFEVSQGKFDLVKICASAEDYAHSVFDFFRQCDRQNIKTIYCETIEEKGIGAALMDRLNRAAKI